jgi:hypothetical protein
VPIVRKITSIALFFCAGHAVTGAKDLNWQAITQWDNDMLTGTDDGYTNGVRIAYTRDLPTDSGMHDFLQKTLLRLSGAERNSAFGQIRFPEPIASNFRYGIGLTQLMFTPKDAESLQPDSGERPYAGWLGLEISLQASARNSASTATLSIGTTGGSSFAHDMQDWVHQNISDSPVFRGWDSQAPGELTVNLHLDHKRRISFLDQTGDWPIQTDGFYEWGGALGNFRTDAYFGTFLRAGYNLPASYTSPRVQLGSFTETIFDIGNDDTKPDDPFSFYGFSSLRGYAVLHDISLDGPLSRDWDESVDSKTWVGEVGFGIAARWKILEVSLSHTIRTDEFENQKNRSRYGSVMLRLTTHF